MRVHLSSLARRSVGLALVTTLAVGGIASAASPAGDVSGFDFATRDETGRTVVLGVYEDDGRPHQLLRFRIRGPRVGWLESHPLPQGTVKWQVILQVSEDGDGPWTTIKRSAFTYLVADKVGPMETFDARTVRHPARDGRSRVRAITRLVWVNEDGGTIGWVRHAYTEYGLLKDDGSVPRFGDQEVTRATAPNLWYD